MKSLAGVSYWCPPPTIESTLDQQRTFQVLGRARDLGLIGSGQDLEEHVSHSLKFCAVGRPEEGSIVADIGSGNGLPGLVLIGEWPQTRWWLVEASSKRCDFLRWAISALDVTDRVEVLEGPAETLARDDRYRCRADVAVARAFGPPAVTAECGGSFVRHDGLLIVSEPPDGEPDRWPASGLGILGMAVDPVLSPGEEIMVLRRVGDLPEKYPRREGVPRRRPLF